MKNNDHKSTNRILIIDDDRRFCDTIKSLVTRMNHECLSAGTLKDGLFLLVTNAIDLVLLDVNLPDGNGIEHIGTILKSPSEPDIIMLTGMADPEGAGKSIQEGVLDYLVKSSPVSIMRISLISALNYRTEKRKEKKQDKSIDLTPIIGSSPLIKACYETMALAARTDSNVLITGETGTGKELFARTIHENSLRSKNRFVVVDCASLTKTLVESILFGHKKGSFTGAYEDRTGLIESADNGTLFLDEIGELPLSIQKNFLRVLQEKQFRPVGGTREVRSDFRLIAATNRSLETMAAEKTFRQDLLFRLQTISLYLPPLKDRKEDIPLLINHCITNVCTRYNIPVKTPDPDFMNILSKYTWPGNVRQLFNTVERSVIASGNKKTLYPMVLPQDVRIEVTQSMIRKSNKVLTCPVQEPMMSGAVMHDGADVHADLVFSGSAPTFKDFKKQMEKRYLEELIRHTGGDLKQSLRVSGLSRAHFYALLSTYGISLSNLRTL